ncbi:MAG: class I SAM-dependent methyltransferase, partial [Bryobacteraceae bacterium]
MDGTGGSAGYALGHSQREMGRLSAQARALEPFTRRMLEQAGVSRNMRVLDVGSGAGDVALLCALLVGPAGEVIGVDRAPAAVETAMERACGAGFGNVSFLAGDPCEMPFEKPFDAVVGRLVLMHQPDSVAMLRKLSRLLRPGGIVAFQEFDIAGAHSFPPAQTFEQGLQWIMAAFAGAGTDPRMGLKLYPTFVAAGLPGPSLSLDAGIWGGANNPVGPMLTDVVRSLLLAIEKFGIATPAQVQIDSLQERIQAEILAAGGVAIMPSLIGAWTRLP